ncbi:GNAT family N-acetyltransferase [Acidithiobacillus thiooxidans]|jgi:GNAT superfamily N-acetyltransferase|uniref:GNAT family N-acetyltransferase n=1 Tax=Acidithiobacillus TaxID=119977 RepID=UPI001C072F3A|nr:MULTISPECIES: GNAT family N-acetyltransferase [Acidithiobacillus]MBU2750413.1 GNAT family N-acetyltransferase [Acidithiobacillus thiooxidans]MBU2861434.1 GNAT family N-acetyltransferase [Acidithiobacillus ferrooxidans]
MNYSLRALDARARTDPFDCGEARLNEYLQRYASQDIKRGIARAFIASPADELERVSGFYTLSAASVAAQTLPDKFKKKLPRYPIPVALLGRLAVDQTFQGQGLGTILVADACKRVTAASETLAVAAIIVDAKTDQAVTFYQHLGFVALNDPNNRLWLPRSVWSCL